jgi:quercetin dioxygenase-like cupin family protein
MQKLIGKIAKTAVKESEKEQEQEALRLHAPAAGAKAGATQGTFTTSDAIAWRPVDPKNHPGLMMFVVWGNPNEGASLILQKYPAGMESGWHWHTAAYDGVVIQGNFTHTFEGAAPQTGGPGSVWSQPARQVHNDKCEESGDSIIAVYFHGKLDFIPVPMKAQQEREDL